MARTQRTQALPLLALLLLALLLLLVVGVAVAEPLLFMPERMLAEPSGFKYTGAINGLPVRGHYFVEPVAAVHASAGAGAGAGALQVIGYRNWQNLTLFGRDAIFYGVSYLNGTYAQATIDAATGACSVFVEEVNCTGWRAVPGTDDAEENACDIVRTSPPTDPPVTGTMDLTAYADAADPNRLDRVATRALVDGQAATYDIEVAAYLADPSMPPTSCGF